MKIARKHNSGVPVRKYKELEVSGLNVKKINLTGEASDYNYDISKADLENFDTFDPTGNSSGMSFTLPEGLDVGTRISFIFVGGAGMSINASGSETINEVATVTANGDTFVTITKLTDTVWFGNQYSSTGSVGAISS